MSKATGGCGSKGKSGGKSKSKSTTEKITKVVALQTSSDHILALRSALRDEAGNDKDVLCDFAKFAKYNKNGLDLVYEFYTTLPRSLFKFCFGLSKKNMEDSYNSCGYGWVDDEKKGELKAQEARFLVIRKRTEHEKQEEKEAKGDTPSDEKKEYVGFVTFGFTLSGEVVNENSGEPSLMLYDLQLASEMQRKGVGKYTMLLLELIAKKQKMAYFMAPVVKHNPAAHSFFTKAIKGFSLDKEYGEDETQAILSKCLKPPAPKAARKPAAKAIAVSKPQPTTTEPKEKATPAPVEPTEAAATKAAQPPAPEIETVTG